MTLNLYTFIHVAVGHATKENTLRPFSTTVDSPLFWQ